MLGSFVMTRVETSEQDFSGISKMKVQDKYDSLIGTKVLTNWLQIWMMQRHRQVEWVFFKWKSIWIFGKSLSYDEILVKLVEDAVKCLTLSEKGCRTKREKKAIADLLLGPYKSHIKFRRMKPREMDQLCNFVDYQYYDCHSIVVLQGEPSYDTVFVVGGGEVDLYYHDNAELEEEMLKAFNITRYDPIQNTSADYLTTNFGRHLKTLKPSTIFGDLLIYEKQRKRSCTVIAKPNTMILTVDKTTYMDILHYYQLHTSQFSTAVKLLKECISFNHYSMQNIIHILYQTKLQNIPPYTNLTQVNEDISSLFLVLDGQINGYAMDLPPQSSALRLPKTPDVSFRRGAIVGERELNNGDQSHTMTYVSFTRCVVFEMSLITYQLYASTEQLKRSQAFIEAERKALNELMRRQSGEETGGDQSASTLPVVAGAEGASPNRNKMLSRQGSRLAALSTRKSSTPGASPLKQQKKGKAAASSTKLAASSRAGSPKSSSSVDSLPPIHTDHFQKSPPKDHIISELSDLDATLDSSHKDDCLITHITNPRDDINSAIMKHPEGISAIVSVHDNTTYDFSIEHVVHLSPLLASDHASSLNSTHHIHPIYKQNTPSHPHLPHLHPPAVTHPSESFEDMKRKSMFRNGVSRALIDDMVEADRSASPDTHHRRSSTTRRGSQHHAASRTSSINYGIPLPSGSASTSVVGSPRTSDNTSVEEMVPGPAEDGNLFSSSSVPLLSLSTSIPGPSPEVIGWPPSIMDQSATIPPTVVTNSQKISGHSVRRLSALQPIQEKGVEHSFETESLLSKVQDAGQVKGVLRRYSSEINFQTSDSLGDSFQSNRNTVAATTGQGSPTPAVPGGATSMSKMNSIRMILEESHGAGSPVALKTPTEGMGTLGSLGTSLRALVQAVDPSFEASSRRGTPSGRRGSIRDMIEQEFHSIDENFEQQQRNRKKSITHIQVVTNPIASPNPNHVSALPGNGAGDGATARRSSVKGMLLRRHSSHDFSASAKAIKNSKKKQGLPRPLILLRK